MEKEISFLNQENEKISGYLHEPERANGNGIVLGHCFTCSKHVKILRNVCDGLAEEGFLVLRFDFSGNGESEGKFEDANYSKEMKDLEIAIDYITKQGIKKIGVLGHSMGAAVAILESVKDKRVGSLCVIASPSCTRDIKKLFGEETLKKIYAEGKAQVEIFGGKHVMNKEFFEDAEKHDLHEVLKNFKRPFCVVHGDNDNVINMKSADDLYNNTNGKKEKHIVKGADHMFSNKNNMDEAINIVKAWFKSSL